jgi:hypothetical protein
MIGPLQSASERSRVRALGPWVAVVIIGGGLRMMALGHLPVDDAEARLGLAALGLVESNGSRPYPFGPLLEHLVGLNFWLFGPSEETVRLGSAVAGVVLLLLPSLLQPVIGTRAAVASSALLAGSPLLLDAARRGDPASLTLLLVLAAVVAAIRWTADRPAWMPWLFMASLGLATVHAPEAGAALLGGAVAAALGRVALGRPLLDEVLRLAREVGGNRWALLLGAITALVAATAAGVDLRGIGYPLGDFWGRLPLALQPVPPNVGLLVGLVAYIVPLLLLAAPEALRAFREHDDQGVFLGMWCGTALVAALLDGGRTLSLVALPTIPAALLGGRLLGRTAWRLHQIRSDVWMPLILLVTAVGAATLLIADSAGNLRAPTRGAVLAILLVGGLVASWGRVSRAGATTETIRLTGVVLLGLWSANAVAHASFAAGPPGSEPFRANPTAQGVREQFHELGILANASPAMRLVVRTEPPSVVRWYGRAIPAAAASAPIGASAIVVERADDPSAGVPAAGTRFVWRFRSTLKTEDLHPLGVARWLATRHGLLDGQPEDAIVIRPRGRPVAWPV